MDEEKKKVLNQTLGAIDLTLLGIGAIIGTGIFVLTGIVCETCWSGDCIIFCISGNYMCMCSFLLC